MASNLDYLAPELKPLEEKVQAYLHTEKELAEAEITATTLAQAPAAPVSPVFVQRPARRQLPPAHRRSCQPPPKPARRPRPAPGRNHLALLPVRDEWVKINLGYGPSRVGAFQRGGPGNRLRAAGCNLERAAVQEPLIYLEASPAR